MRLGWLVPPARLHADLVAAKHASDLGNPALPQLVLARLLATGDYERHLRWSGPGSGPPRRPAGRRPRAPPGGPGGGVAAGLHLLVSFPAADLDAAGLDDTELAERARRPACWCTRCPGTGSGPGRPASSSATPRTRRTGCGTPYGGSPGPCGGD